MDFAFRGKVNNGEVILDDPNGYSKHIWNLDGKIIQVIARKYKTSRSLKQNAYYFGVVIPIIADWMGEDDREKIHLGLRNRFLNIVNNKGLRIIQSTTDLSTIEFEGYLEKIKRWVSMEGGIVIPDPDEVNI